MTAILIVTGGDVGGRVELLRLDKYILRIRSPLRDSMVIKLRKGGRQNGQMFE